MVMLLTKGKNTALIKWCVGTFSIADMDSESAAGWRTRLAFLVCIHPPPARPVNHFPNYEYKLLHSITEPSTTPQSKLNSGGKLRLQTGIKQTIKNKDSSKANDFTPHTCTDNKNES